MDVIIHNQRFFSQYAHGQITSLHINTIQDHPQNNKTYPRTNSKNFTLKFKGKG